MNGNGAEVCIGAEVCGFALSELFEESVSGKAVSDRAVPPNPEQKTG